MASFKRVERCFNHALQAVVAIALLGVSGCQHTSTPIEVHQTATEKWQALGHYAASHLQQYGLYITAKLARQTDAKSGYHFSDIQLSYQPSYFAIDLLQPEFEQKYLCTPLCFALSELQSNRLGSRATLLSQLFEQQQYALFDFYAALNLLNEQVAQQQLTQDSAYASYLSYLVAKGSKFASLNEMSDYLKQQLTAESLLAFKQLPPSTKAATTERSDWQQAEPAESQLWHAALMTEPMPLGSAPLESMPLEQQAWRLTVTDGDSIALPLDAQEWQHEGAAVEQRAWQTAEPPAEMLAWSKDHSPNSVTTPELAPVVNKPALDLIAAQQNWQLAAQVPITRNATVCSFDENLFAVVLQQQGPQITVELLGQAKESVDGVITDLAAGALFARTEQAIRFEPQAGRRDFLAGQLVPCTVQL